MNSTLESFGLNKDFGNQLRIEERLLKQISSDEILRSVLHDIDMMPVEFGGSVHPLDQKYIKVLKLLLAWETRCQKNNS